MWPPDLVEVSGNEQMSTSVLQTLTNSWAGYSTLALFFLAYILVISEELTHLRKSKPVMMAAALIWMIVALAGTQFGASDFVESQAKHILLEYAELLLFLLTAMTYVNAMEERGVFDAIRVRLIRAGLNYRGLFWATGFMAFFMSPIADNLTTALVMCSVVQAVGKSSPKFVAMSCVNIVVAANAGGAFSPFGDITTLMVWQKGVVEFGEFFALFVPSLVNFAVPALLMHFFLPSGYPSKISETTTPKVGATAVVVLFFSTICAAIGFKTYLHLPPAMGMMAGLGALQIFGYVLRIAGRRRGGSEDYSFDVFRKLALVEWDTLLFFYGIMMCVGGLGVFGYLSLMSTMSYGYLGDTTANILIGIASAILDNIPLMFAVLTIDPQMSLGQWLLVTLTCGVGGSLLSIGSAAGVALMGQAKGIYSFSSHLKWVWAVGAGYFASILMHFILNKSLF
jgi:Na+/H+ antiporter NhaD/arsenite permease-like protein